MSQNYEIVIRRQKGWIPINFGELWAFRDLLYLLALRDIKVKYKQAALGILWAVLQPLLTMAVFSLLFGRLAKMPSDGIPYTIFVFTGLLPWNYFSGALSSSGNSLIASSDGYLPLIQWAASLRHSVLQYLVTNLLTGAYWQFHQ